MNKENIVKLAPFVLKRPEYSLNRFYLMNFSNNEIWTGNLASFYIISEIDGIKTINEIVTNAQNNFENFSYEDLYNTSIDIISELVEKGFLLLIE